MQCCLLGADIFNARSVHPAFSLDVRVKVAGQLAHVDLSLSLSPVGEFPTKSFTSKCVLPRPHPPYRVNLVLFLPADDNQGFSPQEPTSFVPLVRLPQ